jgi:IS30 family transposase
MSEPLRIGCAENRDCTEREKERANNISVPRPSEDCAEQRQGGEQSKVARVGVHPPSRFVRHAKGGKAKNGQGHILDMVSIRERPAEAEDRAVPGHWEGDLLTGATDTHIVTLVERHSRFTMLVKLPRKDTTTVVAALAKHIRKLPEQLRRSLTWDQGKEMSGHKRFTVATNVQVYFCDPRSPWQRGSNENTNGLLRQYFPRGTDLSRFSQAYLNGIALRLNQRPRKTLAFETPVNRLQLALH